MAETRAIVKWCLDDCKSFFCIFLLSFSSMNKKLKPLIVILVAIAVAAGAAMLLSRQETATSESQASAAISQQPLSSPGSSADPNFLPQSWPGGKGGRVRGSESAPVTIVEFGDYQCPSCGGFHPVIKELLKREGDNLKFEFHHFPLIQIHANALAASKAAEAAGEQGKYWEMNDALYINQSQWSALPNVEAEFASYAARLGMDPNRFLQSFRSPEIEARVLADVERGRSAQVDATPTFFVNGQRIWELPQSVEEFQKIVQSHLPAAKAPATK